MTPQRGQHFASDNWAGLAPEALRALLDANAGHAPAYGGDAWTQRAIAALRALFECDCEVHFVFNGSAANALALSAICRPFEAVVCTPVAHIAVDECNAAAFFGHGVSLLPAEDESPAARRGQLTPAALRAACITRPSRSRPRR